MASSLLWIDGSTLYTLLSAVGVDPPGPTPPASPHGIETERVHFEIPLPARAPAPTPPPGAEPAPDSGEPVLRPLATTGSSGGPERLPPPPALEGGTLEDRLATHIQWLIGSTGAYAGFIADHDGLPLSMHNAGEDHIAITSALDAAMAPIRSSLRGDPQGSVAIEIDRENVLQVVWANTPTGRLAVGLILPESLGGELVRAIRQSILDLF